MRRTHRCVAFRNSHHIGRACRCTKHVGVVEMAGGSLSPQGAGRYLAGSGRESLPSAPAVMALLASTVTSATVLAGEPPQRMASASMARRHDAPGVELASIGRGHRPRATGGAGPAGPGAAAPSAGGTGAGGPVAWAAGGPPARGGRAGSGRGHRRWALRAGAGRVARSGRRAGEWPRRTCWRAGGRDVGPGPESGCRRRDGRRHRGEVESYRAGGASAGAWGAGDIPSRSAPGRSMCLLTCMNGAETGSNRGILSRDLPPLCAERTRLNRRRQMAT
jgi:hypothetical protein